MEKFGSETASEIDGVAGDKSRALLEICEMSIVAAGASPYAEVWRTAAGFFMIPALSHLGLSRQVGWASLVALVVTLLAMRVIPAAVRMVVPFSAGARRIWAGRRALAKAWDSYQWQKLLYIGLGLSLYSIFSGELSSFRITLCLSCVVFGALGVIRWRMVARTIPGERR
jgi:hypothetical protein